jgi:hypothetical protein
VIGVSRKEGEEYDPLNCSQSFIIAFCLTTLSAILPSNL